MQADSSCTHHSSPTDSTSTWEPAFFLSTSRRHFESFFHATLASRVTNYVTVSMCQERFCHNSDSNSARQISAAELIFLHSSSELLRSRSHWERSAFVHGDRPRQKMLPFGILCRYPLSFGANSDRGGITQLLILVTGNSQFPVNSPPYSPFPPFELATTPSV